MERSSEINLEKSEGAHEQTSPAPAARRWTFSRPSLDLLGLRPKLVIPYALLTLAIAAVSIYIVTRLTVSSVEERLQNQLNEASRVAADAIVEREAYHLDRLREMANTVGVPDAVASREIAPLDQWLWPLVLNNDLDLVIVVDSSGREIVSWLKVSGTDYNRSTGADIPKLELITKVLNGQVDSLGDKYVDIVPLPGDNYLLTSAPVVDASKRVVGAMLIGTSFDTLQRALKTQAVGDIVFLTETGVLLATSLPQTAETKSQVELTPADVADLNPSLTEEFDLADRSYRIIYSSLIIREQTVGVLGVVFPSDFVVATETTNRSWLLFIFGVAVVLMTGVGFVLYRNIVNPIFRLRDMSQAVAAGDLNQTTGLSRPDEIGELAGAFDAMTQRLRERTAEAARLYDEARQRNTDLADANTRLQSTQQQLVQSEKLGAIGQLTAGIVHDVKNPLAVVMGLSQVLADDPGLAPDLKQQLDLIEESAVRANRIVTDLLKFARLSTPEMKQQDIRQTIEAAVRLTTYLARQAQVETLTDLPAGAVIMTYDSQQIEQVIINLIQNAIQAMPEGGMLRLALAQSGDAVALTVQDTGSGISPENRTRIFDPFFTTKPEGEGTGLGLSVSYGIITRHHGQIQVESVVGQGSTFTILLPVNQPQTGGGGAHDT